MCRYRVFSPPSQVRYHHGKNCTVRTDMAEDPEFRARMMKLMLGEEWLDMPLEQLIALHPELAQTNLRDLIMQQPTQPSLRDLIMQEQPQESERDQGRSAIEAAPLPGTTARLSAEDYSNPQAAQQPPADKPKAIEIKPGYVAADDPILNMEVEGEPAPKRRKRED